MSDDEDFTNTVQQHLPGFDRLVGLEITQASATRVQARLQITDSHLQIHDVVHGGVYTCLVETLGSIGAALAARAYHRTIVGIENHTSFLRATGRGELRAVAEPITAGKRTQVWNTRITDQGGQLVATGQLRVLCLEKKSLPNANSAKAGGPFDTE